MIPLIPKFELIQQAGSFPDLLEVKIKFDDLDPQSESDNLKLPNSKPISAQLPLTNLNFRKPNLKLEDNLESKTVPFFN
jgi:hypothetical protein